jgi:uncharacterized protein YPO0396
MTTYFSKLKICLTMDDCPAAKSNVERDLKGIGEYNVRLTHLTTADLIQLISQFDTT